MESFIEGVRLHPCLWNPSHPDYREMHVKDNAWRRVVKHYNNESIPNSTAVINSYTYLNDIASVRLPVHWSGEEKRTAELCQYTQTTQGIADIIVATNNDQGTSNSMQIIPVRVDNKAAERNRLYRERHREEINRRRKAIRQSKKKLNQIQTESVILNINEITSETSNNQRSSNSHIQRQQRYYERHKEEINKRKRDKRLRKNMLQPIPATAAERNRNYRERHKQKINEKRRKSRRRQQQNVQHINNIDSDDQVANVDSVDRIANTTQTDQQNLTCSNDNVIEKMAQNSVSTLQQHNTQHFKETHNDMVQQSTTAVFEEIEVQVAKIEWKKLRDNHRDALKRAKLGKNKLLPAQITTWKYAKSMQFLEPHMKYRITENIEVENLVPVSSSIKTEQNSSPVEAKDDIKPTSTKKRRYLENTSEVPQDTDALESFYNCILKSTKVMPPWMQTQVKKKIFAIIIEAEETLANLSTNPSLDSACVTTEQSESDDNTAPKIKIEVCSDDVLNYDE